MTDFTKAISYLFHPLLMATYATAAFLFLLPFAVQQEQAFKSGQELNLIKKKREERKEVKIDGFKWIWSLAILGYRDFELLYC